MVVVGTSTHKVQYSRQRPSSPSKHGERAGSTATPLRMDKGIQPASMCPNMPGTSLSMDTLCLSRLSGTYAWKWSEIEDVVRFLTSHLERMVHPPGGKSRVGFPPISNERAGSLLDPSPYPMARTHCSAGDKGGGGRNEIKHHPRGRGTRSNKLLLDASGMG